MKTCRKCGVSKPYSEFHKHARHNDGYASSCKICRVGECKASWAMHGNKRKPKMREYYYKRRASDPSFVEYFREYGRKKMKESRELVFKHYGEVCACCGESENRFLSIDHIDGGGNEHRKQLKRYGHNFYRWLVQNNYPAGYRTLCFNCNLAIGFYGQCPHEALKQRDMFYFVGGGC